MSNNQLLVVKIVNQTQLIRVQIKLEFKFKAIYQMTGCNCATVSDKLPSKLEGTCEPFSKSFEKLAFRKVDTPLNRLINLLINNTDINACNLVYSRSEEQYKPIRAAFEKIDVKWTHSGVSSMEEAEIRLQASNQERIFSTWYFEIRCQIYKSNFELISNFHECNPIPD